MVCWPCGNISTSTMPVSGGEDPFLQILSLPEIKPLLDMPAAIETVRQILIDTANGLIAQPEPVQILFDDQSGRFCGDCHIKAAQANVNWRQISSLKQTLLSRTTTASVWIMEISDPLSGLVTSTKQQITPFATYWQASIRISILEQPACRLST